MNALLLLGGGVLLLLLAKKLGLLLLLLALSGVVWFLIATQAWGILTLLGAGAVLFAIGTLYKETHKGGS